MKVDCPYYMLQQRACFELSWQIHIGADECEWPGEMSSAHVRLNIQDPVEG